MLPEQNEGYPDECFTLRQRWRRVGKTAGKGRPKPSDSPVPNSAQGKAKTRDKVAEQVGVKTGTYGKTAGRGRPKTDDSPVATLPQGYDDG